MYIASRLRYDCVKQATKGETMNEFLDWCEANDVPVSDDAFAMYTEYVEVHA